MTEALQPPRKSQSGFDEVAWFDPDADLRTSPASGVPAGIGFESNLPIRRGPEYQNRRNRYVLHYWTPTASYVWCESNFEAQCLTFLEQRGHVASVAAQPFRILFGNEVGPVFHDPDFFARCVDGTPVVIDVKPERFHTSQVQLQFAETRRVCEAIGWRYIVMDDLSPVLVRNLAVLRSARLPRIHPDADRLEHLLAVFDGGRTIQEGRRMLNLRHPALAMPHILHAIWHRRLRAELSAPLNLDTVVTTAQEEPCCR